MTFAENILKMKMRLGEVSSDFLVVRVLILSGDKIKSLFIL